MQEKQKCCLHCPDNWKLSQNAVSNHNCCLVQNAADESSAGRMKRNFRSRSSQVTRQSSVGDRFAIARKFHADNLQHQPLPDKVDDSIFKRSKSTPDLTKDLLSNSSKRNRRDETSQEVIQYGPSLGCKVPTTNMDLAICWEAPINPIYEPSRPVHIDGSDGGPGPAIFALIQRENDDKVYKSPVERFESKFNNVRGNNCECNRIVLQQNYPCYRSNSATRSSGNDLCEEFNGLGIADTDYRRVKSGSAGAGAGQNRRRIQPVHLRNCEVCLCRGDRSKRPKSRPGINSAPVYQGTRSNFRRNGLPTQMTIPRPKTPYAKRDFCIDTLTPPFSIVGGCRDADYPEHWRLSSVYQQSYRNPKKNPL